jgi:hypothetical protein
MCKHEASCVLLQTQLDDVLIKQYEAQLQQLRKEIDAVNRERKLQQTAVGRELRELDHEYYGAVAKNLQISLACQKLQEEIDRWKDRMDALQERQRQQGPQRGHEGEPAADIGDPKAGEQQQEAEGRAETEQQQQNGDEPTATSGDGGVPDRATAGESGSREGPEPMQEG